VNTAILLSVLVDMAAITDTPSDGLGGDPDAVIRQLYSHYAKALHGYVDQFCPDRASADDIVQETFIRAWRHLPQLSADDRPIRPWLFRVARNLLIDANRAAQARPVTVPGEAAGEVGTDSGLEGILDRELVCAALQHLSPAHQTVLVETFYRGGTTATVARELGIPHGTARSRLHYALDAMRKQLEEHDATAAS
jgi:RNA polymerase sigma-70 factor (ECF subfamily)